jgi:hypothetical protein
MVPPDQTHHSDLTSEVRSEVATVQGKPVARRGRKARDLLVRRPPGCRSHRGISTKEVHFVKANLARFTMALSLLATIALTLGAGVKWN